MKHATTTAAAPRAPSSAALGAAQHRREQTEPTRPAAPTKRNTAGQPGAERARRIEQALGYAHLASLGTGPAVKAPTKPAPPTVAVSTKRPAPAPLVKAAPSFAHLAGVRVNGPIYTPPPAPAAVAPKEDGAAIERRLHCNLQSALPLRQQRR